MKGILATIATYIAPLSGPIPAQPLSSEVPEVPEPDQDEETLAIATPDCLEWSVDSWAAAAAAIYWNYPRKVGRPAAIKAILKSLKRTGINPMACFEKVGQYAKAVLGKDPQFIPHPATFFNQDRYMDDPSTWTVNSGPVSTRCKPGAGLDVEESNALIKSAEDFGMYEVPT
jgi:hypothetical protein